MRSVMMDASGHALMNQTSFVPTTLSLPTSIATVEKSASAADKFTLVVANQSGLVEVESKVVS